MFHNEDGDFWIFFIKNNFDLCNQNQQRIDPLSMNRDFFISIPVQWNINFQNNEAQRRILGQQGKFFMRSHLNMFKPLETDNNYSPLLKRYKIPKAYKADILEELKAENYNDITVYKSHKLRMKIIKKIIEKRVLT